MAISFVRESEVSGDLNNTVVTLNIESSGVDRALVLVVMYRSNSLLAADSVVFNTSENFSLVRSGTDAANAQVSIYVLPNPTVTTADVVLTFPSSVRMTAWVGLYTGVHQTTPFTGNTVDAQGTDATALDSISSAVGEVVLSGMVQVAAGPETFTTTNIDTERHNNASTGGGTDVRGGVGETAGAATVSPEFNLSGSEDWNIVVAALQEAPVPQATTPAAVARSTDVPSQIVSGSGSAPVVQPSLSILAPSAIVAPTVAGSGDSPVVGPAVTASAVMVAPTVSGSGETPVAPPPVQSTALVVEPSEVFRIEEQVVSPGPVTSTALIQAPKIDLFLTVPPVTAATAIQDPTVAGSGNASVTGSVLTAPALVVDPTVAGSGEAPIVGPVVTAPALVIAPTVFAEGEAPVSPTPVPRSTAIVAPGVTGTGEGTVTGPVLTAPALVVGPSVFGSGETIVTPPPVQAPAQVVPGTVAGSGVAPVVGVAATAPALVVGPTVAGSGESFVTVSPVVAVSAIQAPQIDLFLGVPAVVSVAVMAAPGVAGTGEGTTTPGPVVATSVIQAPGVSGSGSPIMTSNPVVEVSAIQAPVVSGSSTAPVTPTPLTAPAVVIAPTALGSGEADPVTPGPLVAPAVVVGPVVSGSGEATAITPAPMTALALIVSPVVSQPVAMPVVTAPALIVAPVVAGSGTATAITPAPLTASAVVVTPGVAGSGEATAITPTPMTAPAVMVAPLLSHTLTSAPLVAVTAIVAGEVTSPVFAPVIGAPAVMLAPVITPGPGAATVVPAKHSVPKNVRFSTVFNGFASGGNGVDGAWRIKNQPATVLGFWRPDDKDRGFGGGNQGIFGVREQTSPANDNEFGWTWSNNSSLRAFARRASGAQHGPSNWDQDLFTEGQWYFLEMSHDPVADTLTWDVNRGDPVFGGAKVVTGITDGIYFGGATASPMEITGNINGSNRQIDGAVSGWGIWVGRELSAAEKDFIFDTQPSYADLPDSLKVDLVSWHDCEEPSGGTFIDQAPGGVNLVMINGSGGTDPNGPKKVQGMYRSSEIIAPAVAGTGEAFITPAPVVAASAIVAPQIYLRMDIPPVVATTAIQAPKIDLSLELPVLVSVTSIQAPKIDLSLELPVLVSVAAIQAPKIDLSLGVPPAVATTAIVMPGIAGSGNSLGINPSGTEVTRVAQFTGRFGGYLGAVTDTSYMVQDELYTAWGFFRIDDIDQGDTDDQHLMGPYIPGNANGQWLLMWESGTNRFRVGWRSPTASGNFAHSKADYLQGEWVFGVFEHDPVANELYVEIDNTGPESTPFVGGFTNMTSEGFSVGGSVNGGNHQLTGGASRIGVMKGRRLTAAEKTWIFNNRPTYEELGIPGSGGADLKDSNLVSFWNMDEAGNDDRIDSHGSNDLIRNGNAISDDGTGPSGPLRVASVVVAPLVNATGEAPVGPAPLVRVAELVAPTVAGTGTAPVAGPVLSAPALVNAPQIDRSFTPAPSVSSTVVVAPVVQATGAAPIGPAPVARVSAMVGPTVIHTVGVPPAVATAVVVAPRVSFSFPATPLAIVATVQAPSVAGSGEAPVVPASLPAPAVLVTPDVAGTGEAPVGPAPLVAVSQIVAPELPLVLFLVPVIATADVVGSQGVQGTGSAPIIMVPVLSVAGIHGPEVARVANIHILFALDGYSSDTLNIDGQSQVIITLDSNP